MSNLNFTNLRAKVNTLVQKGQIPEPRATFTFKENMLWHCVVEIFVEGKKKVASAESATKNSAHELALAQIDLPLVKESKNHVPLGKWEIVASEDELVIEFMPQGGQNQRKNVIKNTSNIFSVMQKMARDE